VDQVVKGLTRKVVEEEEGLKEEGVAEDVDS